MMNGEVNVMNVVESLISRIEDYRKTNKTPCRNYATKEAAEKAANKMVTDGMEYYQTNKPARYTVLYNEVWNRWVFAIDMTEYSKRADFGGGYMGYFDVFLY